MKMSTFSSPEFSGETQDWVAWKSVFTSWLRKMSKMEHQVLKVAEDAKAKGRSDVSELESVPEELARKFQQEEWDWKEANINLYDNLVIACKRDAAATIRTMAVGDADKSESGALAWFSLLNKYEVSSRGRFVACHRQLIRARLDATDPDKYFNEVDELRRSLQELSKEKRLISDEEMISFTLEALPKSLDFLKTMLNADENVSYEKLKIQVRGQVSCNLKTEQEQVKVEALAVKASGDKNERSGRSANGPRRCFNCNSTKHLVMNCDKPCQHCGKTNHPSYKCYYKKKNEAKQMVMSATSEQEEYAGFVLMGKTLSNLTTTNQWIIDTGATHSMAGEKSVFETLEEGPKCVVTGIGKSPLVSTKRGTVRLTLTTINGKKISLRISDVLYVPDQNFKLISVLKFSEQFPNATFEFGNKFAQLFLGPNKSDQVQLEQQAQVYMVPESSSVCAVDATNKIKQASRRNKWLVDYTKKGLDEHLVHCRLGHAHAAALNLLQQRGNLPSYLFFQNCRDCESCVMGKSHRKTFKSDKNRVQSSQPMELIHTDVWGPTEVESLSGAKYAVLFVDDFTRMKKVYFMKSKNECLLKFQEFLQDVLPNTKKTNGQKTQRLRSDGGGEYINREFTDFCKINGIQHETSAPYSPEQNGVAERCWRTLAEMSKSMLHEAKMPKQFWAEAMNTACFVANLLPTSALSGGTPFDRWFGGEKKFEYSRLKVFGCVGYVHIERKQRHKLDFNATLCVMLGYDLTSKAYRLWNPQSQRVIKSFHVTFHEEKKGGEVLAPCYKSISENSRSGIIVNDQDGSSIEPELNQREELDQQREELNQREESDQREQLDQEYRCHHPLRQNKRVDYSEMGDDEVSNDEDYHFGGVAIQKSSNNQQGEDSYAEAKRKEYDSLMKNEVFDLVPRSSVPKGNKVVSCRWVLNDKFDEHGVLERRKARLVARGFTQRQGKDYDETFAPVAKLSMVRLLVGLAAANKWKLQQMDVETAFLNAKIDGEVYIQQPPGFEQGKDMVCKLKKSLYGLKQSPRNWNMEFDQFLTSQCGMKSCLSEPCLYTGRINGHCVILLVYVDDILLTGSEKGMQILKNKLMSKYRMKDIGDLCWFLGLGIQKEKSGGYFVNQTQYANKLLERFNMSNCRSVSTPALANSHLTKNDCPQPGSDEAKKMEKVPYRAAVGALLYLAMGTRPDIMNAVREVSCFNTNPGINHWTAVKRIFRYIKGSLQVQLRYLGNPSENDMKMQLHGFADSDWAGNGDHRRSVSGHIFMFGGGPVSWSSKTQKSVALSSCEAEYIALSAATQEAIYLRNILEQLEFPQHQATMIYEDNQGCIAISKNPVQLARTKHIDVRHHFIREKIHNKEINCEYISTTNQMADGLTKAVGAMKLEEFRKNVCWSGMISREGVCEKRDP